MINLKTVGGVHTHTHTSNSIEQKEGVNNLYLSYKKQTMY